MKKKLRVGIIFGGRSAEHEVSLLSAKNVVEALDREKYEPILIGIDKKGGWHLNSGQRNLPSPPPNTKTNLVFVSKEGKGELINTATQQSAGPIDVVFPVLHGPFGEDGTIQGLLKLAGVPFVGAGVLGSAVGMDKDVAKRLLRDAGISIAKFFVAHSHLEAKLPSGITFNKAVRQLGLPFFIKPANLGSSVGVHKVKNKRQFTAALADAFRHDTKILIEEYIQGREIECAVLGNENPIASVPGEIIPHHEFYSYEAKYLDPDGAGLEIPARIPARIAKQVQELSVRAFRALSCEGMGRVDFFLTQKGKLYVNEINTIPGFTKISMYPKLWEASGIPYPKLIDRLIRLAIERFKKEQKLKTAR